MKEDHKHNINKTPTTSTEPLSQDELLANIYKTLKNPPYTKSFKTEPYILKPMSEIVYPSISKFHAAQFPNTYAGSANCKNKATNENHSAYTVKLERLKKICAALDINLDLFKSTNSTKQKKYILTREVASLYTYILKTIDEKYPFITNEQKSANHKGKLLAVADIITLRDHYRSAMESVNLDTAFIEEKIYHFSIKNNCPFMNHYITPSPLTERVIKYLKDTYKNNLADYEWLNFEQEFEYIFQYYFYPYYLNHCETLYKRYVRAQGMTADDGSDDETIDKFFESLSKKDSPPDH